MKTRRFIALLLAGLMIFALCACGDSKKDEVVDGGDENMEINAPALELSSMDVTSTFNGEEVSGNILVSPLTREKFNPESTLTALRNLECLKDWRGYNYATSHCGNGTFAEGRDSINYDIEETITLQQLDDGDWPTGNEFVVTYPSNTAQCINYSSIEVEFSFSDEEEHVGLTTDDICEILKVIYGEEIGTFIHSDMDGDENYASYTFHGANGYIDYFRNVMDNSAIYSVSCSSYINPVKGHVGNETTKFNMDNIFSLLNIPEEERNVFDYTNFCKTFFTDLVDGEYTLRSNFVHTYLYNTYSGYGLHGQQDSATSSVSIWIDKEGENSENSPSVLWSDGVANGEKDLSLVISFGYFTQEEMTEEKEEIICQKIAKIIKDMFDLDVVAKELDNSNVYNVKLNGEDAFARFSLFWDETSEEINPSIVISVCTGEN